MANFSATFANTEFVDALSGRRFNARVSRYLLLGGPRFNWRNSSPFIPYAHALFGVARYKADFKNDDFTCPDTNETAFAMALGAGLDIKAGNHIDIRAAQVDYLPVFFDQQTGRWYAILGGREDQAVGQRQMSEVRCQSVRSDQSDSHLTSDPNTYFSFSFCRWSKKSDQASPFFLSRAGTFLTVKSEIFTPCSICFQVSGIETVAFGFARAVKTDARLFPRAFCIQST